MWTFLNSDQFSQNAIFLFQNNKSVLYESIKQNGFLIRIHLTLSSSPTTLSVCDCHSVWALFNFSLHLHFWVFRLFISGFSLLHWVFKGKLIKVVPLHNYTQTQHSHCSTCFSSLTLSGNTLFLRNGMDFSISEIHIPQVWF